MEDNRGSMRNSLRARSCTAKSENDVVLNEGENSQDVCFLHSEKGVRHFWQTSLSLFFGCLSSFIPFLLFPDPHFNLSLCLFLSLSCNLSQRSLCDVITHVIWAAYSTSSMFYELLLSSKPIHLLTTVALAPVFSTITTLRRNILNWICGCDCNFGRLNSVSSMSLYSLF